MRHRSRSSSRPAPHGSEWCPGDQLRVAGRVPGATCSDGSGSGDGAERSVEPATLRATDDSASRHRIRIAARGFGRLVRPGPAPGPRADRRPDRRTGRGRQERCQRSVRRRSAKPRQAMPPASRRRATRPAKPQPASWPERSRPATWSSTGSCRRPRRRRARPRGRVQAGCASSWWRVPPICRAPRSGTARGRGDHVDGRYPPAAHGRPSGMVATVAGVSQPVRPRTRGCRGGSVPDAGPGYRPAGTTARARCVLAPRPMFRADVQWP
jgi:hypothetical protein